MDKESKAYMNFEVSIRKIFGNIGPESKIKGADDKKFKFLDNIFINAKYVYSGPFFKDMVLEEIPKCQGQVNLPFAYALLMEISQHTYRKIKTRAGIIENTLDSYLQDDDIAFAFAKLNELLDASNNKYRVFLITDIIDLRDVDSIQLGNVIIRKINDNFVKSLPEAIESKNATSLGSVLAGRRKLTPDEFLEENKNNVSLETDIKGYHLNSEMSPVFDSALFEYRQVCSYLFMSKQFLANVQSGKFTVETKDVKKISIWDTSQPAGLQKYYIKTVNDSKSMKNIDIMWHRIALSHKIFTIDNNVVKELRNRCCLEKFNRIYQGSDFGTVKQKITRSLDWFLKAMLEKDSTDEVISLFISLESLLSTDAGPLTSHTDDMAENVAIMLTRGVNERYQRKKEFKNEIYDLRNKIMHHGKPVVWDKDWDKVCTLRNYVVWSIRGIIQRIDEITRFGKSSKAIREYFEREKLK